MLPLVPPSASFSQQVLNSQSTKFQPIQGRTPGQLSIEQISRASFLLGSGATVRDVAQQVGSTKSVIGRVRQMATGSQTITFEPKSNIIQHLRRHFVAYKFLENPFSSAREVSELSEDAHITISKSEVNRLAHEMGFRCALTQKREKLTDKQKRNRVAFCQRIESSRLRDVPWVFSDESMLVLNPLKRRVRVIRGYDAAEKYIDSEGYPVKLMVWGAIGRGFKPDLVRVEGMMTAPSYVALLRDNQIFEKMNRTYGRGRYVFQQDGARPHTAGITKEWIARQKVATLDGHYAWPANSPDLSVIENCWAIVKANIDYSRVTDADSLFEEAQRAWREIPMETIDKMINDFEPRRKTVIVTGGDCLNECKAILSEFRKSDQLGMACFRRVRRNEQNVRVFCEQSSWFFSCHGVWPKEKDAGELLERSYAMSCQVCGLLPDNLRERLRLPLAAKTLKIPTRPLIWPA